MIDLRPGLLQVVLDILARHVPGLEVRAFGSRVTWTAKEHSDLDLVIVGDEKLDFKTIARLQEAFDESDLPIRVDVLDWNDISPEFQRIIERGHEVIQKASTSGERGSVSEWQKIRLGDVCEKIGSGATPRGGNESYKVSGTSLIRSQNVYNEGFKRNGLAFIDGQQAAELENVIVNPGDVLLNITGDSVARCCQVPDEVLPARVNQHVAIIRPKSGFLDARYLRYFLITPAMQNQMLAFASAGGTRNALTKGMIESFEIAAPPLPEQRAIAEVLGALDDKIELNRRMNATLEEMAEALFKAWFVDSEEAKGWDVKKIGDICEFAYGKGLKESERRLGIVPVIGSNGKIGWHSEYLVKGPGIVIGRKGNPGTVTWVQQDFFPIDTTFYIVSKDPDINLYWLYYALLIQNLPNLSADSAVPGLNRNIAYMSDIVLPPSKNMKAFKEIIKPIFDKISSTNEQSRTLAGLRDTLLPRLMRGEVLVRTAD